MPDLPTGTVTFLVTDIEGSTNLLNRLGDAQAAEVFKQHRRILRSAFLAEGGYEFETQGDALLIAFATARGAVLAAVAGQRVLARHPWPAGAELRVRIGLHTGEPVRSAEGYVGLDVHRAARIRDAAWGGQILLSRTTRDLVEDDLPEGVRLRELGPHRLKDLQRPEPLYQIVHPELRVEFPPLRSLERFPNNLPLQLTSFIGREREMTTVKRLLNGTRLLTLTGSGGCGKTRLALQSAADLVDGFEDGVWLVELASLSDPALLPQAVASTLGVREQPGRPLVDTVMEFLRPRHLLLLLDNCEHLVAACARLAEELLRGCPHLQMLATSREALNVPGETPWLVPSLSSPDSRRVSVETLSEFEAVRLLVDRATAVRPDFHLTSQEAPVVALICQRLDGIPLAIELAAARMRVLSAEQIAQRLDDMFRLLTRGGRMTPSRHQTLRGAMDWSFALLVERERTLFRRLSVFAGGFSLEATEAVCAGSGIGRGDVLDLVSQLVDKSLVAVEQQNADVRYRLLEPVRQYAREKLQESGEDQEVRRRHRGWCLQVAEEAEPELRGPRQRQVLEHLDREYDNMLAALDWSRSGDRSGEAGLRLASALFRFWWMRGHLTEGRRWLEGLLGQSPGASPAARARALIEAGRLAWAQSDFAAARRFSEEGLALSRSLEDKRAIAEALNTLVLVALSLGDYERARATGEEGIALSRELGDRRLTALLLNNLGIVDETQGSYAAARARHEESLRIRKDIGDQHGVAYSLGNLGRVAALEGDLAAARAFFEKSLVICREFGDKLGTCNLLTRLGLVVYREGDVPRAAALCEESLTLARGLGDKESIADALGALGRLAHHARDDAGALALLRESLILRRDLADRPGIAECLEQLASAALARSDPSKAARLFGAAHVIRTHIGAPLPPVERPGHDRDIGQARAALGDETFEAMCAGGRAGGLDRAIEDALTDAPDLL